MGKSKSIIKPMTPRFGVLLVDHENQAEIGMVVPVETSISYGRFKQIIIKAWERFTTNYAVYAHLDGAKLEQFVLVNNRINPMQIAAFEFCLMERNEEGEITITD